MQLVDLDIQEICDGIRDIIPDFEDKRILITGSNGFLGKYFATVLHELNQKHLKKKCHVVLMDSLIVPNEEDKELYYNFKFIKHDISKPFPDADAKFDYIINAAGIASPHWYNQFQKATIDVGIDGLKNMLELSVRDGARLLFFSSSEIYGTPPDDCVPTKETYVGQIPTLTKRSAYDISKLMGETMTYVYNNDGADAVIVRPFNFTGPGMSKNDYRVLPLFVSRILEEKSIAIFGDGLQTRSFCYITDAINGCLRVLVKGRKGEPYNIGNTENHVSMTGLVDAMNQALCLSIVREMVPSPINYITEPLKRCPDTTKARQELGYAPRVGLTETIVRFYNWAKEEYR